MATATSSPDAGLDVIEPEVLYPLADAMRRLGIKRTALREFRRRGLKVRYLGRRAYLIGRDIIEYVMENSTSVKPGFEAPEPVED